jgi:hypothetical protein
MEGVLGCDNNKRGRKGGGWDTPLCMGENTIIPQSHPPPYVFPLPPSLNSIKYE